MLVFRLSIIFKQGNAEDCSQYLLQFELDSTLFLKLVFEIELQQTQFQYDIKTYSRSIYLRPITYVLLTDVHFYKFYAPNDQLLE